MCDTFGQTPWWATPENSSVFGLFTSGFQPNIENKDPLWCWSTYKEPMFITGVRTSNYKNYPLAISAGRKIEYAIVVEQLTSVSCTGRSQDYFRDVAVGWCTITDLNNSTCVPVEGSNVVVSGNVLEVQRSTEYNGPQGGNIWLETPATEVYPPLYTNIYFGEMISTLFTDVEMTTPYKPASADAQFINYNYKILSQGVGYTNPETGNSLEVGQLQWAASFSSITGAKISYTDQVGSIQTSGKPLVIDGGERNYIYTTATATTIQDKGQYFLQWPPNKPLIPNNGPC